MTWLIVIGIAVTSVIIQAVGLVVIIMQDIRRDRSRTTSNDHRNR